jgi:hypothetical protein
MKSFARHLPHYVSLFGILLAGFSGLILFSYDRLFQSAIAIALGASYVVWGIVHHAIHRDLYWETIIEYIAIAALGLTIIFSLIIRA